MYIILSITYIYIYAGNEKSVIPTRIKSDDNYNVKTLVLKQVDRITFMLSINRAGTQGLSENFRALGFGVKSGLMSLEALISPYLKEESEYFVNTTKIKKVLDLLEKRDLVDSTDFRYWELLNSWLACLVNELSKLGYFPQGTYDYEEEYD